MFPELQAIASRMGLAWITRLELIIGAMHEVAAEELARQFEACFEGTSFEDARVEIVIVQPDQTISAPGRSDTLTATGWEILIRKMEGRQ